ncbi:hypothetical protein Tco_0853268 [Tanacetum coccineum]
MGLSLGHLYLISYILRHATLRQKPKGQGDRPPAPLGMTIRLWGGGEVILHVMNRLIEDRGDYVGLLFPLRTSFTECRLTEWLSLSHRLRFFFYSNPSERSLGTELAHHGLSMLLVDFKNAFNLTTLASLPAWYLDGGTIVEDTLVAGKGLELIMEDSPCCGLHVNIDKTKARQCGVSSYFMFRSRSQLAPGFLLGIHMETMVYRVHVSMLSNINILLCVITLLTYAILRISTGKEVDIELRGGSDKPLRPADMLLYSWDEALDLCVDLIEYSPLTQIWMTDFVYGCAMTDEAQRKTCQIRKFSLAQDIGARVVVHIFNRISFAIAKGVGAKIWLSMV